MPARPSRSSLHANHSPVVICERQVHDGPAGRKKERKTARQRTPVVKEVHAVVLRAEPGSRMQRPAVPRHTEKQQQAQAPPKHTASRNRRARRRSGSAPGQDLPVDHPGAHVGGVHAQDGRLRGVDDGGGQHAAKHSAVAAAARQRGPGAGGAAQGRGGICELGMGWALLSKKARAHKAQLDKYTAPAASCQVLKCGSQA